MFFLKHAPVPAINVDEIHLLKPFSVKAKRLSTDFLQLLDQQEVITSIHPQSFESLETAFGFVNYETEIHFLATSPAILKIEDLRDRAYVYVDDVS